MRNGRNVKKLSLVGLAILLVSCGVTISTSTFKVRVDCVMNGGIAPGYSFTYGNLDRTDSRSLGYHTYTFTTPPITGLDFGMRPVTGLKEHGLIRCDFTLLPPNSRGKDAKGTILGHKTIHGPSGNKIVKVYVTLVRDKVGMD